MAANARNGDGIDIALIAGLHRPQNIVGIEDVDILVHQDDVLQLRIGGKGGQSRLALSSLVGGIGLFKLHDGQQLAAACGVGEDVQQFAGHRAANHIENARFGWDTRHVDVFLTWTDGGAPDGVVAMGDRFDFNHRQRIF